MEPDQERGMAVGRALFGFNVDQMREASKVPTIMAWCRHMEGCFRLMCTDQYADIWSRSGFRQPQAPPDCWSLFQAVLETVNKIDDAEFSIEDVWRMVESSPATDVEGQNGRLRDTPNHDCLVAVFAVLCWGSMILQPRLTWEAASVPRLSVHQLPDYHPGLKMEHVRRPIPVVFRNLRKFIDRRRHAKQPVIDETIGLFVSTINYHSLRTTSKVRLEWVDNLSSHLSFNAQTRTLSVFRFPSFCAMATIAGDRCILMEELTKALIGINDESGEELESSSLQLNQEVLMSYRLLFGQTRAARELAKTLLREMASQQDFDHLLFNLCTWPRKEVIKTFPECYWPVSCRDFDLLLQEDDSYSSRDDFPILGSRLAAIQEFNLRQQPSRLRDLWRDRRNPLQWYTFWAVLVVGGLGIVLSFLQLLVGILQLAQL